MKRPLVNILILVLLLVGLLMVGGPISRSAQNPMDANADYLTEEPNEPEPEFVLNDGQIIFLSEESDGQTEDEGEQEDGDEADDGGDE
jgi:hypothetical protein